jgi:acyl-[acyl-carrier-protein]-phospholipid O-acyltransferase / long-chain-fatty-acid--[acyl-carrier-protein] ligase
MDTKDTTWKKKGFNAIPILGGWVITKILLRIKTVHPEHIPAGGGALLIANHVSRVDALLIASCTRRPIRFIVSHETVVARQALNEGCLVCVFSEGQITQNGMLQAFNRGLENIVEDTDTPIIPVYLGGVWGSRFSAAEGHLRTRSRRLSHPVSIHVGQHLPSTSTASEVRQKVEELACDYVDGLKHSNGTLPEQFIRSARRHWTRRCVADVTGKDLTYGRTLIGSVLLSQILAKRTQGTQNIGIMLPPSVGGVLANVAVGLLGKTSVNLSYVISETARAEVMARARVQHVITSRTFLEKLGLTPENAAYIFVEDLIKGISAAQKLRALLQARLLPLCLWRTVKQVSPDDTATILFSSGSTGTPKGVMLSHHNLASNLESVHRSYTIHTHDTLCGVLPFFHAFGLNITLWLPITVGVPAFYIPNPLDGKAVAQSIREKKATILLSTPTFLYGYLRRASDTDFVTLRSVIVGAEKMSPKLARLFEKKFGIRLQEGYGATELSPLVSLNLQDVDCGVCHQIGTKLGTVGQPVPGVTTKVVSPDTGAPLGVDEPGLLLVKAPNLMQGYLHDPDKTREVIRDGWYNTGDIASMGTDGFITIQDRLSRFSKIGGEMVSHGKVEEICVEATHSDNRVVLVTSRHHETKGEELVVLYVPQTVDPTHLIQAVRNSDLPNLSKPKPDNFIPVDAIPLLGSGKPDFMKVKTLVNV